MALSKSETKSASVLLALLLVLPVSVLTYGDTGVVLADLVSTVGAIVFFRRAITAEAFFLLVSIVLATIVCVVSWMVHPDAGIRPLGSLVFFFKPMFAYFVPFLYVRNQGDIDRFFSRFSVFSIPLLASVWVSIALAFDGVVRAESVLHGSFVGLPIFGSYGVNSLAVFYALCAFIAIYVLLRSVGTIRFVHVSVAFGFGWLAFASLSREAALGLTVMCAVLMLSMVLSRPVWTVGLTVFAATIAALFLPALLASDLLAVKVAQIMDGVASGDWDALSSGRLTLYGAALREIWMNPFVGVGFQGFGDGAIDLPYILDSTGLSPHNQYITAVWKMGIFPAIAYFAVIAVMLRRALAVGTPLARRWCIALVWGVFLVFANLWDVLIIPNVGALVFFILGMFASAGEYERVDFDDRILGRS